MLFTTRIREVLGKVSMSRLYNYTAWYWKNHIRPHFFQEEKILLPYVPADHPLAKRMQDEHIAIREYILSLDQYAEQGSLRELCDLLETHIRFEEEEFFPYLEDSLTEKQLNNIHIELNNHPVANEEWKDKFWVTESKKTY